MIEGEGSLALCGRLLEFPAEPGHLLVSDAVAVTFCFVPSGCFQQLCPGHPNWRPPIVPTSWGESRWSAAKASMKTRSRVIKPWGPVQEW